MLFNEKDLADGKRSPLPVAPDTLTKEFATAIQRRAGYRRSDGHPLFPEPELQDSLTFGLKRIEGD